MEPFRQKRPEHSTRPTVADHHPRWVARVKVVFRSQKEGSALAFLHNEIDASPGLAAFRGFGNICSSRPSAPRGCAAHSSLHARRRLARRGDHRPVSRVVPPAAENRRNRWWRVVGDGVRPRFRFPRIERPSSARREIRPSARIRRIHG